MERRCNVCRLKQIQGREERLEELSREVQKPLARYEGDADLESHLKEQELKEDPMYDYMQKKKRRKQVKKQGGYGQPISPFEDFFYLSTSHSRVYRQICIRSYLDTNANYLGSCNRRGPAPQSGLISIG